MPILIYNKVFWFEITMDDLMLMKVFDGYYDLCQIELGSFFFKVNLII